MRALARAAALVAGLMVLVSSGAWLVFAAWLVTPLGPCLFEGRGECDGPTAGMLVLGLGVVAPGGVAGLALAAMALRYALTGRVPRLLPYPLFVASVSFAVAMVWIAVVTGQ